MTIELFLLLAYVLLMILEKLEVPGNVCCQLLGEHTTITVFQIYPYERLVVKHFQLPPDVDRTCLEVSFFYYMHCV